MALEQTTRPFALTSLLHSCEHLLEIAFVIFEVRDRNFLCVFFCCGACRERSGIEQKLNPCHKTISMSGVENLAAKIMQALESGLHGSLSGSRFKVSTRQKQLIDS